MSLLKTLLDRIERARAEVNPDPDLLRYDDDPKCPRCHASLYPSDETCARCGWSDQLEATD